MKASAYRHHNARAAAAQEEQVMTKGSDVLRIAGKHIGERYILVPDGEAGSQTLKALGIAIPQ